MDKYDPAEYERLIAEQRSRYPAETLAPEYAELLETNTLQMLVKLARYKFVARLLKSTDDVLEVGAGSGLGTIFLSQHAKHVTGLEINPHEHEAACAFNRRSNVRFALQSVFNYAYERAHDVVVALDVIEHLSPAMGAALVLRMAAHCKPTGMIVVGSPSIHSYPYQSKVSQAAHVKCYDQAELVALADRYFGRTLAFSMNDEIVHTGHPKLAWYYFVVAFMPRVA